MGFPRQEDWSGLPFLSLGIIPTQEWYPCFLFIRETLYHWASWEPLFYARGIIKVLPALKLSAKNPAILGLVYREESGRDSEKRNLNSLLQKCLFLAQSHFSRWLGIPGSDINSVQSQFSWYMLKYVTTCWWKLPGHLVHGWMYDLEATVWVL